MATPPQELTTTAKYICNLCDCISIGNKGDPWVLQIFKQFPYANVYTDRVATQKDTPGQLQNKGDGKKNRSILNLFTQFYPGLPKYPNDNIGKRLEWLSLCLDKLLEIPNAESFAFPPDLGFSEILNYEERYRNCLNDFRKKYFLKHQRTLKLVDYLDQDINGQTGLSKIINYDAPISVLKTTHNDNNEDSHEITINVIKKINLDQLMYILPSPNSQLLTPTPTQTPTQTPIKIQTKTAFGKCLLDDTEDNPIALKPKIPITIKPKIPIVAKVQPTPKIIESIPIVAKISPKPISPKPISPKPISPKPISHNPVLPISKPIPETIVEHVVELPSEPKRVYDKNPLWGQLMSELAEDIHPSWDVIFRDPEMMGIMAELDVKFQDKLNIYGDAMEFLPNPPNLIFNAFKLTPFPPKAIIVGQDPYFSNMNEAMGLSFSVPDGVSIPPSLANIFKELTTDIEGFKSPKSGNLTQWAQQGVLLLNTALTVLYKHKEAHMDIWQKFTDTMIRLISQKSKQPIVFMLWGIPAKKKEAQIADLKRHMVLKSSHPSPLSCNQGGWFNTKPFSQCNAFLTKHKISPINWKF